MRHLIREEPFVTGADVVKDAQRRMDDAWQAAIAEQMGAVLIGHDPKAFRRLGAAYEDHWRK